MKQTKTKYLTRVSSLAMGVGILASAGLTTATSVFAADYTPKTYETDKFDAEYSRGILYRLNDDKIDDSDPNVTMTLSSTAPATSCDHTEGADNIVHYFCDNTSLDENIYITIKNAAIYQNKYIDVREYIWVEGDGYWGAYVGPSGGIGVAGGNNTRPLVIHRQLRFYEANTAKEISFKGVISFTDMDENESYSFSDKKGFHEAFIPSASDISIVADATTSEDGTTMYAFTSKKARGAKLPPQLYVEVSGSSQNRFQFNEMIGEHDGGSHNTSFSKVSYNIKNGSDFSIANPSTDIVVTYGQLTPLASPATTPTGYDFNGWYSDSDYTVKASAPLKVADNITLRGKFDETTPGGGGEEECDEDDEECEPGGGGEEGGEGEEGKDDDNKGGSSIITPDTGASTSNSDGLSGGKAMIAPILLVSLAALLGTGFAIKAKSKKKVMKFGR